MLKLNNKGTLTVGEIVFLAIIFLGCGSVLWYSVTKKTQDNQFTGQAKQVNENHYHITKNYALVDLAFTPFEIHGCTKENPEIENTADDVNDSDVNDVDITNHTLVVNKT